MLEETVILCFVSVFNGSFEVMIQKHKCHLNLTNEKIPSCTICGKEEVLEINPFFAKMWKTQFSKNH